MDKRIAKTLQESNDRVDAASAFIEAKLGHDCYDDYFYGAKLALWLWELQCENVRLAAIETAACEVNEMLKNGMTFDCLHQEAHVAIKVLNAALSKPKDQR